MVASAKGPQLPTGLEQYLSERIGNYNGFLAKRASGKEHQMDDERKSTTAAEHAAEGLLKATGKEEAKNERKTGHDLAKGADRFEERSKSSDGKSAKEKQKG